VSRSARSATLLDAFALRRVPLAPVGGSVGALESACALGPLTLLVAASGCGGAHRLFLARDGRRLEGVLHLVAYGHGRRWEAAQTGGYTGEAEWLPDLLQAATAAAAVAGVSKMVARLEHEDHRLPCFEDAGFRPYSQETVYARDVTAVAPVGDGFIIRPFCRQDEWRVLRLYHAMTPPNVQTMEAMAPRDYVAPFARGAGLVVERGGELLAAVGVSPRWPLDAALLTLLLRVDAVAAGEAALLAMVERLGRRGVRTALLPVRDYMADALAAARLAGMAPVVTRSVLVKHTQALVRPPVFARLREAPAALPAVNGTRLVHSGAHVPQCRLRHEPRPRRREAPASVA
jgi:hypothetical protein